MTVRARAERLEPVDLRRAGVPRTVMSDAEFGAAVLRDRHDRGDSSAGYDRRGLLNVVGILIDRIDVLEGRPLGPPPPAPTEPPCRFHPEGCPPGMREAVRAWLGRGRSPAPWPWRGPR